jgi:hypothetical protein
MRIKIIKLPSFQVVGISVVADVGTFEAGLGKSMYARLLERKHEIPDRKNDHVMLMQIYLMDEHFMQNRMNLHTLSAVR